MTRNRSTEVSTIPSHAGEPKEMGGGMLLSIWMPPSGICRPGGIIKRAASGGLMPRNGTNAV